MAPNQTPRRDDAPPRPPAPRPPAPRDAGDQQTQSPLDALQNLAFLGGDANVAQVDEVPEGRHRTSPLSIVTTSAQGLLVSVLVGVSMYASLATEEELGELVAGLPFDFALLLSVGTALLALAIAVAVAAVSWRTRTWELTDTELVLRSGVFVRNERRIPYQRVHSVDLSASVIERILGLVSLKVDTGADAANVVNSLRRDAAESLKRALFARRALVAKANAASDPQAPLAADTPCASAEQDARAGIDYEFNLPNAQHVRAALTDFGLGPVFASAAVALGGLLEFGELIFGAYVYDQIALYVEEALGAADALGSFDFLAYVPAVLLSTLVGVVAVFAVAWLVSVVMAYVRWGGFVLRRRGRRIEVSCGLLSRSTRAVDLGRVQSVSVDASPIRRALGLVQVAVRTVGSVGGQNGDAAARERVVVHPCLPKGEAAAFIAQVLPEFAQVVSVPVDQLGLEALPRVALRRTIVRGGLWALALVACAGLATWGAGVAAQGSSATVGALLSGLVAFAWVVVVLVCAVMFVVRVLAWRLRRIGTQGSMLVAVDGGLGRHVTYVARPKVQSLTRRVSPLQARSGVATVMARTACISAEPDPKMRDVSEFTAANLMEWARPHYDNAEAAQRALREAGIE